MTDQSRAMARIARLEGRVESLELLANGLAKQIQALQGRVPRHGPDPLCLLSCREVDRQYRLRHGTAAREVRLGRVPARRRGRGIYILARRAALVWGAP